jgi:hypothetical protein
MISAILVTKADGTRHVVGPFDSAAAANMLIKIGGFPRSYTLEVLDMSVTADWQRSTT